MAQKRFNLIDEPWIPVVNEGLKSLKDVFSGGCKALGGTPREKISLYKLLLAIAQAAWTPKNFSEWKKQGAKYLGEKCLAYLDEHRDAFFLYGEKPFLQMPVQKADIRSYGCFLPEVATGNTSRLTDLQTEFPAPDAQRALILICEMSMCLGGKKTDKNVILSKDYKKSASGAPGPGMCTLGLQHSFLTGNNLLETLWLNLIDQDCIERQANFKMGLGTPPWIKMPEGENCQTAQDLQQSFIGRLVPLARFCLLTDQGMHYVEGIKHPDYQVNFFDPSVSYNKEKNKTKMLWTDTEKRPWRNLASMLGFLDADRAKSRFDCLYLNEGIGRIKNTGIDSIGIWCGGFRVSSNAGEQYATGKDDCVESEFSIDLKIIETEDWYSDFQREMKDLEKYANILYSRVNAYLTSQKMNNEQARTASEIFWQKAERYFPELLNNCKDEQKMAVLHAKLQKIVSDTYDSICAHDTSRQIQEWAKYKPFMQKNSDNNKDREAKNE